MSQQPYQSDHDMLMDKFSPQQWQLAKWMWYVLFEGSYFLLMVFFRYRIGKSFLTFANWFRGALLLGVFWIITVFAYDAGLQHDTDVLPTSSIMMLWIHSICYNLFFIWRWAANIYYLRRSYKPDAIIVPENNIGDSVLYRIVRSLLSWTGLFDDEIRPKTFWKLNENRFMQVIEPVGVFLLGMKLVDTDYVAYGLIFMIGACAMARVMFTALNNNARITHSQREADYYSGQQPDNPGRTSIHNRRVIGD